MSGETVEDYFRRLNLGETRRKFLENIKEGKQEENGIDEHYLNGISKEYSPIASDWYSIYMKRFVNHRYTNRGRITAIHGATITDLLT